MWDKDEGNTKPGRHTCPGRGGMQRKVAYVFLYKNGIRERSVGILKRYGTAEQPEVALELFGEERKKRWDIYYFTKGEVLAKAAYLWGSTGERGRNEVCITRCRLCVEAGEGKGIVLLPAEEARAELNEYLCGRYDGKEVTAEDLREAFRRKPEQETPENPCVESAKRLMEEITIAAGGELPGEEVGMAQKRRRHTPLDGPEKLLCTKPAYSPCRPYRVEYSVRVTPEDLYCLPKESGKYIENSYLLHGFYRYRHVLFGRRKRKEREDYVLLVPGYYSEKEAKLAETFGFPEFLPVKGIASGRLKAEEKPEADHAASGKEMFGYFCGKI